MPPTLIPQLWGWRALPRRLHAPEWDTDLVEPPSTVPATAALGLGPRGRVILGKKGVLRVNSVRVARATGGGNPPRWLGHALRTTAATALGCSLIVLATPSGDADPHGGPDLPISHAATGGGPTPDAATTPGSAKVDEAPAPQLTPTPASFTAADLKHARAEAKASADALATARGVLDQAVAAQTEALALEVAAQDALLAARVRLGDLIAAEDAARVTVTAAADRVEAVPSGSHAHRAVFIEWQMAAVAERAAHARRTIAEEAGAKLFADLQAVEEPLADAEIALGDAQSAHRKAERTAAAASSRVAELETVISTGTPQPAPNPTPRSTPVTSSSTVRAEP